MNKSVLIACAAVVALVLWMLSGQFGALQSADTQKTVENEPVAERSTPRMKVQTRRQIAEQITREIVVQGQVEPLKILHLRSETGGTVERLPVNKGQRIAKDEVIAELSADNRQAKLAVARANQQQAEKKRKSGG